MVELYLHSAMYLYGLMLSNIKYRGMFYVLYKNLTENSLNLHYKDYSVHVVPGRDQRHATMHCLKQLLFQKTVLIVTLFVPASSHAVYYYYFIFLFEYWEVESILGSPGTAATPAQGDCEDGDVGGINGFDRVAGKTEVLGENLPRRHFVLQNPTCQTRPRTRTARVGSSD
jgi:hypothetical protein